MIPGRRNLSGFFTDLEIDKRAVKHEQASEEILRLWKTRWDAYMKSMMAMQEQGETMLDMIQKSGVLQEKSQKRVMEWADKYKVIKSEDILELKM